MSYETPEEQEAGQGNEAIAEADAQGDCDTCRFQGRIGTDAFPCDECINNPTFVDHYRGV